MKSMFFELGRGDGCGTGRETLLSRISPARGSRSMAKGRKRNYGPRRTRMKGLSFGRRRVQVLMDRLIRIAGRIKYRGTG